MRPKQWTKNFLVFAGLLFTLDHNHPADVWLRVFIGFGLFCAVSGATYIFNDAADVERDRMHPRKSKRPIACGTVPVSVAMVFAAIVLGTSVWASFWIGPNPYFGLLLSIYALLSSTYSVTLKHLVIVDLLAISAGFVLRAVAGAVVIPVEISPWLLLCTTLLALFLALAKRRGELTTLVDGGPNHRKTLAEYTVPFVDQLLGVTAAAAIMAYCLYTFTPLSETGKQHPYMMMTIPFVIYGLFRYLFLIHTKNAGSTPEATLVEDKPLLINVILYVIAAAIALKI